MAITKEDAERILGEVPSDKCFICGDGCIHRTLSDLQSCLSHMDEQTFSHHVTSYKNDFSNWVRDVMGDVELADELTKAKTRKDTAGLIKKRLAWLQKAKIKAAPMPAKGGFYENWTGGKKNSA
jgi:hypothetical protein